MNKKWQLYDIDEKLVQDISQKYNINELLSTILANRNIVNKEKVEMFLNPTRKSFYNPFLLQDMEKAVVRIIEAINKKEKIIIYGDYDVDGITSITTLKRFLDDRGAIISYYIPKRLEEGYGLNKNAIEKISQEQYNLIITVDCGISALEEVEYINSKNIDVIITDHHETLEELPNALAVVNPKRIDNKYPFRELAGVGVVFKLIQAISETLKLDEKEYLKYLDLVCVGTISDIVPLVDENRVITKLGLKLIHVTKNIGLKALIQASGYKNIDSNAISYGIGPRVNACGRMGYEEEALQLFLTEDAEKAKYITENLNKYNKSRQEIEKNIYEEVIQEIEKEGIENLNSIVLGKENWHHGVIGIVSSKITETYYKPTILICFENDIGKGSGRSIQGFDLHDALCKCSKYLTQYGGHEMAVGLKLEQKNYNDFKMKFEQIAKNSNIKEARPIIYIDKQILIKDINKQVLEQLKVLEPFGEGNRVPVFLIKNMKINSIRAISQGKHLKLTLKEDSNIIDAIGFNLGSLSEEYLIDDKVDIVANLEINSYNGMENIQLNIKDIMKSI